MLDRRMNSDQIRLRLSGTSAASNRELAAGPERLRGFGGAEQGKYLVLTPLA